MGGQKDYDDAESLPSSLSLNAFCLSNGERGISGQKAGGSERQTRCLFFRLFAESCG